MRIPIVVICGDTHTGSTFGLCAPGVVLDGGNEYLLSPIQKRLYEKWEELWGKIDEIKKAMDAEVVTIFNGDMIDNNRHATSERISGNPADLLRAAYETLSVAAVVSDSTIMVRGTEAHTGVSGNLEETLAHELGCRRWPNGNYSGYQAMLTVGGVRIFAQHHPGTASRLPWTRGSAANRLAAKVENNFAELGLPPPHLAFFGHNHNPEDSFDNHRCRAIILPSWKLTDAYGHRFGGDWLPIGGAYTIIGEHKDDAQYRVVKHFYDWPNPAGWKSWG